MGLSAAFEKRLGGFHLRVSLDTDGGVLGLLGASGCGKSLTLKCIAGIERPDRGRIVLDGVTLFDSGAGIDLPPQRRGVGYLFQSCALFPNMTVRQNILCALRRERDRGKREAALREAVSLLHLEGLEDRRPCQLSGGTRSWSPTAATRRTTCALGSPSWTRAASSHANRRRSCSPIPAPCARRS